MRIHVSLHLCLSTFGKILTDIEHDCDLMPYHSIAVYRGLSAGFPTIINFNKVTFFRQSQLFSLNLPCLVERERVRG